MKRIGAVAAAPLLTPVLAVVWVLLNNSLAPGYILLGLLLGWAIPRFTLAFWPERVRIHAPARLLRFAGVFLYDVLVANLSVARLILVGPARAAPAFVVVPLDLHQRPRHQRARQHYLPHAGHRVGAAVGGSPPPAGACPRSSSRRKHSSRRSNRASRRR